jgi:hypothetical protein
MLERLLRFVLSDVQLWVVMIVAAALAYWLTDFTSEMLTRLFRARPALPSSS